MADVLGRVQVIRTGLRRKTLALEVHPSGEVFVRAPEGCDETRIDALLLKRQRWIAEQRAFFLQFDPRTPTRAWVPGESHLHLGRRYKLQMETGPAPGVQLRGSDMVVTVEPGARNQPEAIESTVQRWRHQQAKAVFSRALEQCHEHYRFKHLDVPHLRIQRLAKRWGSLSSSGAMTLHSALVQAPGTCISYVIFHELCHAIHPDHSRAFFDLLAEVCPKWVAHKHRLEALLR